MLDKGRAIDQAGIKLHLGCGSRFIPGYVHVDLEPGPHVQVITSIDNLAMFPDGVASLAYCSHALEYFDLDGVRRCLGEWYRVLQSGGTVRLAVPNFPSLIEVYESTNDIRRVLGPLFGRIENPESGTHFHRLVFDERLLTEVLQDAGFTGVRWWDWRKTEHAHIDDHSQAYFPHLRKDDGLLVSLNLEADRP